VIKLSGYDAKRMTLGSTRVIFTETPGNIIILDIGPRASIYSKWPRRG